MRLGVLYSRVRTEEKLLFEAMAQRGIEFEPLDDRKLTLEISGGASSVAQFTQYDLIVERCINHSRALNSLRILNDQGIATLNTAEVVALCGNKLNTTSVLAAQGIAVPRTMIAYSSQGALEAVEALGYPAVLKPAVGSWGRLLSKVNVRETVETIVEHKAVLGSDDHSVFYIQEYIAKPERDIRAFVLGNETICAIYRDSAHWITNTARGGNSSNCPVTAELNDLCVRAARAVGGGMVAIDVLEDPERGLLVNEVNHNMEFRNSSMPTGVDIPARIVEYCLRVATEGWAKANGWQ